MKYRMKACQTREAIAARAIGKTTPLAMSSVC
jgi:hypothetical protein